MAVVLRMVMIFMVVILMIIVLVLVVMMLMMMVVMTVMVMTVMQFCWAVLGVRWGPPGVLKCSLGVLLVLLGSCTQGSSVQIPGA
eukprot:7195713-Pyramimonas_sp.AAC.1